MMGSSDLNRARDTGLALVLALLIIHQFREGGLWTAGALLALVLAMAAPGLFRFLVAPWYGFSEKLGAVMSKVILTLIYLLIATPVGLARRLTGADPMRIKQWKKSRNSVFTAREHTFTKRDLQAPY